MASGLMDHPFADLSRVYAAFLAPDAETWAAAGPAWPIQVATAVAAPAARTPRRVKARLTLFPLPCVG